MKRLVNNSNDPFFNLACEEWLMKTADSDYFMIWQNSPSVIIGLSQNAFSEVNIPYAEEHGIKIARRITGGGAVYHDLQNINFSFVVSEDSPEINFTRFLEPVVAVLNSLGIRAVINGRNDIEVDGAKISGNAQCHKYGKILHHGTLLYKVDVDTMSNVLCVDEEKIKSKGIKSVRSRVGQISNYTDVTIDEFFDRLCNAFDAEIKELDESEIAEISNLSKMKFSDWDFVFGSSRQYEKCTKKRFEGGTVQIEYNCERGIINDVKISGDFFSVGDPNALSDSVRGCRLVREDIVKALQSSECMIYGVSADDIANLFFN